ncbi:MAG: iron chelate uptake ABC transporter family permease subunit, partial [Pseudomonadota bacterium]
HQPLLTPIVGLIYGGIVGAIAIFVAYQTDLMQYLGVWMSGEFSGILAGRYEFLWLAGAMAAAAYFVADRFTIAGLGETASKGLGLPYRQVVLLGLVMLSMVSAMVVATVGLIPFVGLVAPNIVSRLMGDNLRASLPVVAGSGAGLVLTADVVGRLIRYPYEIPAGLVCAMIGSVVFLWLLFSRSAGRA